MRDGYESRVETKLDAIASDIREINVTLAKQSVILDEHQRRSLANEEAVEVLKRQHNMIAGALKLIGLLATIGGIIELFLKR